MASAATEGTIQVTGQQKLTGLATRGKLLSGAIGI